MSARHYRHRLTRDRGHSKVQCRASAQCGGVGAILPEPRRRASVARLVAATAEAARWQSIRDVRIAYPSADGVKLNSGIVVTVFNVRGNEYRLLTSISYQRQDVYVLVLTHAEYDNDKWKGRL